MLKRDEFKEMQKKALELEGIKRFEYHFGPVKWLHSEKSKKLKRKGDHK